jgi:hypothetical protein
MLLGGTARPPLLTSWPLAAETTGNLSSVSTLPAWAEGGDAKPLDSWLPPGGGMEHYGKWNPKVIQMELQNTI